MARLPRIAVAHANEDPDWSWVLPRLSAPSAVRSYQVVGRGGTGASARLRELKALRALRRDHRSDPFDLVLSFGPFAALRVGLLRTLKASRHDVFAFNFTDLPTGPKRIAFRRALRRVSNAYVLTEAERALYASAFSLPFDVFSRVPWGVAPPEPDPAPHQDLTGPYVAALGGEARDYATLIEAARRLPKTRFVLVARPHNVEGLDLPGNVVVRTNIPLAEAWQVVDRARLHVLPLRSHETPCGIVTLVGAMHLGAPQVITEAVGVTDYAVPGVHALTVAPKDAAGMAGAIGELMADEERRAAMGEAARSKASRAYSEASTLAFAERLVRSLAV